MIFVCLTPVVAFPFLPLFFIVVGVLSTGNILYMPVATSIPNLIKRTIEALEAKHAPNTLDEVGIQVPGEMWVSIQFCPKNPASARALQYTGKLNLLHKV